LVRGAPELVATTPELLLLVTQAIVLPSPRRVSCLSTPRIAAALCCGEREPLHCCDPAQEHVEKITAAVHAKYPPGAGQGKFQLMEADLCHYDPSVNPVPGGCMAQDPVATLQEIDWMHLIYSPTNATIPNIEVRCAAALSVSLSVSLSLCVCVCVASRPLASQLTASRVWLNTAAAPAPYHAG